MIRPIPFILLLLLFVSFSIVAQDKGDGWVSLFNGKDLSGWRQLNGKASYTVRNGVLVGTTVAGQPNSFLATEKDYGDFQLELDLLVDSSMNSGVQFRSESRSDYMDGRVHGYQMEVDPSSRAWSGGIYDEGRRLWLYSMEYNPAGKKAFRNGQWNHYRIECIGNRMRTWINDLPTAELVDDMTPRGFVALQVHAINKPEDAGRQIMWKNIRIREKNLKPWPEQGIFIVNLLPNELTEAQKKMGVSLLWDGKTTDGWRGAYKTAFPGKGWEIREGTLNVLPSAGGEAANGGDIVTDRMFGAFELQFEFRLTEGANSGVKYFVTEKENNSGSAIGLEYQVLDDDKHPDAKLGTAGNRTLASLYDLIPSIKYPQSLRKIGEWNRGMIRVYPDNHVEHFLNGYKVVEYERGTQMYRALVARSKYVQWPDFGMAEKGHILLQDHGNAVSFRSIRIREIPAAEKH
jgi:hypothetical protein